ncbi:YbaY family lipoprotein [Vibrio lentus]|nr:YbaY family lipoprotein [Vibrio lentus]
MPLTSETNYLSGSGCRERQVICGTVSYRAKELHCQRMQVTVTLEDISLADAFIDCYRDSRIHY